MEARCWRNERKKDFSPHASSTRSPFLSRDSLSLPSRPPFSCPAFSSTCLLARLSVVHTRGTNRIRNKTNPISKCAGPTRGSNQHGQTGSRSFYFSAPCSLSPGSPPLSSLRVVVIPAISQRSALLLPSPFARDLSFPLDSPSLSLARVKGTW